MGGGGDAAEEHCSVPVTRDEECADAVASLSDIKSFVSRELARMTPPVEASALVSVVPTPRDARSRCRRDRARCSTSASSSARGAAAA